MHMEEMTGITDNMQLTVPRTSSAASKPVRLMPDRPCNAERSGPPAGIDGLERSLPAAAATRGSKSCPVTWGAMVHL